MASFLRTRGRGDVSRVPLEVGQGKRPRVPMSSRCDAFFIYCATAPKIKMLA